MNALDAAKERANLVIGKEEKKDMKIAYSKEVLLLLESGVIIKMMKA